MRENLSIEGLLLQTRRVVVARWPWLLGVAVVWGLVTWQGRALPMRLMMAGAFEPESPWLVVVMMLEGVIGAVGAAAMIGVVVRTGLPRRPLSVAVLHAAFAGATVMLALIVHGFGGMVLREAAAALAGGESGVAPPLGYVAGLLPPLYQIGLFVFLGMAMPAALERLVSPWKAAVVSLKLTEGYRLWIGIIAVVWSAAALVPIYGLSMLAPMMMNVGPAISRVGQMLTAVAIGVLYLELRRLRGGAAPGATAETFA